MILPVEVLADDVVRAARALIGCHLVRDAVVLRITEVEAYAGPEDTASHCRMGPTPRNAPMWGPPGRSYVYLCYGVHAMLNIVAHGPDGPGAVLIRACEPVAGLDTIRGRRRGLSGPPLLAGPGRVAAALGLDTGWSDHPLLEPGGLELRRGPAPVRLAAGPRVGVGYASADHQARPWRFADADSAWVSQRRHLGPLTDGSDGAAGPPRG